MTQNLARATPTPSNLRWRSRKMRRFAATMKTNLLWLALSTCLVISALGSQQDSNVKGTFSFASYYESNMVLQAYPARSIIWGFAPVTDIGSLVYLNLSNAFQLLQYKTYVKSGCVANVAVWQVTLDPITNVHPFSVITALKAYKPLVLQNVLFGDVWFCSGQSNMQFTMKQIFNSTEEAKEAEKFDRIRFFSIAQVQSSTPLIDISKVAIHWSVPNRENILPFSAVCWLFAKYVYQQRSLPIGLVESSWGGTEIEAWSSPESLKLCGIKQERKTIFDSLNNESLKYSEGFKAHIQDMESRLRKDTETLNADEPQKKIYSWLEETAERSDYMQNMEHSCLWNAMVYPLLNMTIFGVLWYQGEANSFYNINLYNCTLPAMVGDWRKKWYLGTVGQTNISFPFGIVQLGPTSGKPSIAGFSDIRWHQTADRGYLPNKVMPNTFMAVAYDMADAVGGVHYRDKLTVSRRLALSGMAVAYGKTDQKYMGPLISKFTIDAVNSLLRLEYDDAKYPIVVRNDQGFEICCKQDSKQLCSLSGNDWLPALLTSWSNNTVALSIKACQQRYLMGIRFAWRETPCDYKRASVYSVENDLPAPPFIVRRLLGPVSFVGIQHRQEQNNQEDSNIESHKTGENLTKENQEGHNNSVQQQHLSENEEQGRHVSEIQEGDIFNTSLQQSDDSSYNQEQVNHNLQQE